MTALAELLREQIRTTGPITVEAYMAACNSHYYATRDPLGAAGDFTTAPEISQMFGELVGACLADCWARAGKAAGAVYAELGPGRGTLAADALRVLRRTGISGEAHLVETSPALRDAQKERLGEVCWHERIDDLPPVPLLLAANEFFDALPVRQWVGAEERRVMLSGETLAFTLDGTIHEDSPVREQAFAAVARHLAEHGGIALVVDYGHARSAPGDTLQAVRGHCFADPLHDPGEQDLTTHVDFEALERAVDGLDVVVSGPVTQSDWLLRLGIEQRARSLIASNPARRHDVEQAMHRLCGREAMGELFKVMAVRSAQWPEPAGFVP